jgi:hypothetical protein
MKVNNLSLEEMAQYGATHKFVVTYEDLNTTAGTALTVTLRSAFAARSRAQYVGHRIVTNFDGGATSELTVALGYDLASGTDDTDAFLAATSIHEDGTEILSSPVAITDVAADAVDGTYGAEEAAVIASLRTKLNTVLKYVGMSFNEAWDLEAVFTSTGANLTALTQGEVHFYFRLNDLRLC